MEVTEKTRNSEEIEELEIRIGLMEECQTVRKKAVADAFKKWRYSVGWYVRKTFPVFTSLQVKDVVSLTFLKLLNVVEKEGFDTEKPLYSLIINIAHKTAIDEYRKTKRFVSASNNVDDFIDSIYNRIHGTVLANDWEQATTKKRAEEIQKEFRIFVSTLPPGQRIVAKVILDNLPTELSYADIAEIVLEETGESLTGVQIKGRLEALRAKFREIMRKRLSD